MANDTKYITLENLTRLASKIKADIQLKQDQLQFAELPDAATCSGKVVQYVGDNTAELKAGAFYKSDGTAWAEVNVMETPEPAEQNLLIVGQLPAWADADASKVYAVKQASVPYTTLYYLTANGDEGQVLYPAGSNDPAVEAEFVFPNNKIIKVFGPDVTEQNMPIATFVTGYRYYYLMPSAGYNEVYLPIPADEDVEMYSRQAEQIGARIINNNWGAAPIHLFENEFQIKIHTTQKVPTLHEASVVYDEDKEADSDINGSVFIVTEPAKHSLAFYAKKADETDAWYTVQTGSAAQPVDLPTFTAISDADIEVAFEA